MSVSVRIVAHAYAKFFSKYIAIMKKKVYNTPVMEVAVMMPTTIICASITGGDPVTSLDPPSYGD